MIASVIIPTYNRGDYFDKALDSAAKVDFPRDEYEIIVVDSNESDIPDEKFEPYRKEGVNITYVKEPRLSFSLARHAGAEAARSDILCYIDDDAVVTKKWLRAMVDVFDADKMVGMVGGHIEPSYEGDPPLWQLEVQKRFNGWSLWNFADQVCEAPGVCGPSLSVRKSVLEQVGGFPPDTIGGESEVSGTVEKLLIGPGDWGLSREVKNAGYKIMYAPEALIYHAVPPLRMKQSWWKRRFIGEGYMTAFTEQVWEPRNPPYLILMALKSIVLAIGGVVAGLILGPLRKDKGYLYRFGAAYMLTRAKVQLALAKNPGLAKKLWDVGLRGINAGEIDALKKLIP